ncbi:MAG: maltokinase N-terminal cap-like domain-containing protein, partial [Acidimicrobiales bacterium]
MISPDQLAVLLPDYLPRQRWFAGGGEVPEAVDIEDFEVLQHGTPALVWALARVEGDDAAYQVLVGLRPLEHTERFLEGKGRAMLGDVDSDEGPLLAYDALVDPDLARLFLTVVAAGEHAELVRPLVVEQSNTSVVYDDRLILKLFRRVHDGPNPDRELSEALESAGWTGVPTTHASWQRGDRDLAVVRDYIAGGTDGWQLALTSLRDLYDRRLDPEKSGGDFAPEAYRLGLLTAEMHAALADALGAAPADATTWRAAMLDGLRRVKQSFRSPRRREDFDPDALAAAYERLAEVGRPGAAIRIHGDLHLGQVLRSDAGWYVLDFEGEPRVPLADRRHPSSPLRDMAGMLRSFDYVAAVGLRERGDEADIELAQLGHAWEARNRAAYVDGYESVEAIQPLLPPEGDDRRTVLAAFELAKAVYEVGYEQAHRPDWTDIPLSAIGRLMQAAR